MPDSDADSPANSRGPRPGPGTAPPEPGSIGGAEVEPGHSLWQDAWHRLRKNKLAVLSAVFLLVLSIPCLFAEWIAPESPETQNLSLGATPPSRQHWLGTDALGRDMLARIFYGGRVSLAAGLCATAVSLIIGVLYGTISGYIGGRLDVVMMRGVDILYSLPFPIFVILLMVLTKDLGDKIQGWAQKHLGITTDIGGSWNLIILFCAIGAVEWLTMARIVRGQVLSLKQQDFVEAARALGLRKRRIILRHIIPNVLGIVIVYTTLIVPSVMLLEAFLSFLGFGVQPPRSSWGTLINDGSHSMEEYPWLLIFPGLVFASTLFSLNFLGDGLRDALDVRASKD
jgi:oligopeptide transport system permease protein